jgi:hypothetical protein
MVLETRLEWGGLIREFRPPEFYPFMIIILRSYDTLQNPLGSHEYKLIIHYHLKSSRRCWVIDLIDDEFNWRLFMLFLPAPEYEIKNFMTQKRPRLVGIYGANGVDYSPYLGSGDEREWSYETPWLLAVTYQSIMMNPREMDFRGYPLANDFENCLRLGHPMIVGLVGNRVFEHRRSGLKKTADRAFLHAWGELQTDDVREIQKLSRELFIAKLT